MAGATVAYRATDAYLTLILMVQKLKKHYPVEKRTEHFQIDPVGSDLYVLTVWDEDVQFVCNYEHILWCAKELIDSQLFPELDPSQDEKICELSSGSLA